MPNCRNCGRPVFFVRERPEYVMIGTYNQPKEILTDPRPFPVDVNPNNLEGTVALYESNQPIAGNVGTFARKMYNEVAKAYRRLGGVLYTSHFETCPNRPAYKPQRDLTTPGR